MSISNAGGETGSPTISALAEDPAPAARLWRHLRLLAILLVSLALRLWGLAQNGWGNEYYSAGVRSMTTTWTNFLYNSFDPAGFVSVDKPPVALWIQAATVKLFGFHGFSLFLPQVLEGVASVWIIYHLVRRRFGERAGVMAALFLAITPVSVAIDRSNNTDSCLVLVLLLAAWALIRATEDGSRRLLLSSMVLVGIGFNVKMLAAFVVLPAFWLVYFLGAPVVWRRRFEDLAISGVVLTAVSLAWVLAYDLTPAEHRPFAGTTKKNSMLELAVGPYAVGRFVAPAKLSETSRSDTRAGRAAVTGVQQVDGTGTPGGPMPRSVWRRLFVRAPAGLFRLADGQLAGQVGWLVPLAVMGLAVGAFHHRLRSPLVPQHLDLLLWFCWTLTYGVIYSAAGGIMHLYYLATMAPPLAALAGIGVVSLWERYVQQGMVAFLLPITLLFTVAWQLYVEASALNWNSGRMLNSIAGHITQNEWSGNWLTWLHTALFAGTCVAAGGLLVMLCRKTRSSASRAFAAGALGIGLLSLLVLPTAWALSSVLVPGHGVLPSADLARVVPLEGISVRGLRGGFGKSPDVSRLVSFLKANRRDERYLLATSSARLAAPIIVSSGEAVMAMGGFHGLDPILDTEKLARMVEANQVRFVMLGDLSVISRRLGAEAAGKSIAEWVKANGKLVDSVLWRSHSDVRAGLQMYDLHPSTPFVPAPSR